MENGYEQEIHHVYGCSLASSSGSISLEIKEEVHDIPGIIYSESGSEVFIKEDPQGSHFLSELDSGVDLGSNVKIESNDTVQFSEIKKAAEVTTSVYHYGTLISTSHLDQNYCLPLESCSSQLVEHSDIHFEGSEFLNIPVEEEPELDISDVEESKLDPPDNEKPELDISNVEESELDTPNNEKPELDISDAEESKLETSHNEEPDVYRECKEEVVSDIHHAPGYSLSSTSGENALKIKVEADDITAAGFENIVKLELNDTMGNMCDAVEIQEFSEIKKECEAPPHLSGIDLGSNVKVECNDTVLFSEIKKEPEGTTSAHHHTAMISAFYLDHNYCLPPASGLSQLVEHSDRHIEGSELLNVPVKEEPELDISDVEESDLNTPDEEEAELYIADVNGEEKVDNNFCLHKTVTLKKDNGQRQQMLTRCNPGEGTSLQALKKERSSFTKVCDSNTTSSYSQSEDIILQPRTSSDSQSCSKTKPSLRTQRVYGPYTATPFECKICGKTFAECSAFLEHWSIHTGEKTCKACAKCFAHSGKLKQHKRIHTGKKLHECHQCRKRFTLHSNLTAHKRIHTGEKPYECDKCGQRFTYKNALTFHVKIHK